VDAPDIDDQWLRVPLGSAQTELELTRHTLMDAYRRLDEQRAWMLEASAYLCDPDQWTPAGAEDLADRCPVSPDDDAED